MNKIISLQNFIFTILLTILLTILATSYSFADNNVLPKNIENELQNANINLNNVGLYIQKIEKINNNKQQILVNYNGNKLFTPASVMKLVTTYAGILHLGTDFVWQTKIYSDSKVDINGNLNGNLYIVSGGDPNLTFDELYKLLTQLSIEYNIKNIKGNVIFNNSFFKLSEDLQNTFSSDFDGYPFAGYNVIPKPLILDLQTLQLMFYVENVENNATKQVKVKTIPPLSQLKINTKNILLLDDDLEKNCANDWEDNLTYKTQQVKNKIVLNIGGIIQLKCLADANNSISNYKIKYIAALNNFEQNIVLFNSIWQQLGGTISGKFIESNQQINFDELHHNYNYIMTYNSKNLGETIKYINKYSNNVMARLLYLSLPLKNADNNINNINNIYSLELSNQVIKEILQKYSINFADAIFDNGSGLSRKTKFSLHSLNSLLIHAYNNKKMPEFLQSLPIFGEDGTLKKQYANSVYKGKAHLKTGSINGVKNIAGYYQTDKGNRYTMIFFINDENISNLKNYAEILHLIFDYIETNDK